MNLPYTEPPPNNFMGTGIDQVDNNSAFFIMFFVDSGRAAIINERVRQSHNNRPYIPSPNPSQIPDKNRSIISWSNKRFGTRSRP